MAITPSNTCPKTNSQKLFVYQLLDVVFFFRIPHIKPVTTVMVAVPVMNRIVKVTTQPHATIHKKTRVAPMTITITTRITTRITITNTDQTHATQRIFLFVVLTLTVILFIT